MHIQPKHQILSIFEVIYMISDNKIEQINSHVSNSIFFSPRLFCFSQNFVSLANNYCQEEKKSIVYDSLNHCHMSLNLKRKHLSCWLVLSNKYEIQSFLNVEINILHPIHCLRFNNYLEVGLSLTDISPPFVWLWEQYLQ